MATETENNANEIKSEEKENIKVDENLLKKIVKQIDYYFGNYNLPRDKFLQSTVKKDKDGWVGIDVMLTFKRLASICTDSEVIFDALKASTVVDVDATKKILRRSVDNPLPVVGSNEELMEDRLKRTIYCKGFPKDDSVTLDILNDFFESHGPIDTIHLRKFVVDGTTKTGFKGSILICFATPEIAKKFVEVDDISYKNIPLIRKWHKDYLEEKSNEIKERKERKKERLENMSKEGQSGPELNEVVPLPRGSFIHCSGFTNTTMREDIKAAMLAIEGVEEVAFIDLQKGDTEGYVRFAVPECNEKCLDLLKDLKVCDNVITSRLVSGEEEDEQLKKGEEVRKRAASQPMGKKRKFPGGGRGGRGRGRGFKRRRM